MAEISTQITGRHKGQRIFVCGTSPNLQALEFSLLKTGVTIGVNQFAHHYTPDYWLTCDPQNIKTRMNGVLGKLYGVETFVHKHPHYNDIKAHHRFERPPTTLDRHRQPVGDYTIPTEWAGYLQHHWTSATAAANLADILLSGDGEIVLFGVDIKGPTQRGTEWVDWSVMADDISRFFHRLRVPVYKTLADSPLDLPLWPGLNL